MQYIFLTDVDGTLLRRDVHLSPEVIHAAHTYTARGGLLSLCTGRSLLAAREIAAQLGVNAPSILYGGAEIYHFQEERCLASFPFSWDVMQAVRHVLADEPDVSVQVFTQKRSYLLRRNQKLEAWGVLEELQEPAVSPDQVSGPILKIGMCCENPQRLQSCRQYFPEGLCNFSFSSRTFVDVVAANCGKRQAMEYLSESLKIPFQAFFCAGDAITDLPVLRRAGISFAPQDAMDEVKAAVSVVVPSVKQCGMATAFAYASDCLRREAERTL